MRGEDSIPSIKIDSRGYLWHDWRISPVRGGYQDIAEYDRASRRGSLPLTPPINSSCTTPMNIKNPLLLSPATSIMDSGVGHVVPRFNRSKAPNSPFKRKVPLFWIIFGLFIGILGVSTILGLYFGILNDTRRWDANGDKPPDIDSTDEVSRSKFFSEFILPRISVFDENISVPHSELGKNDSFAAVFDARNFWDKFPKVAKYMSYIYTTVPPEYDNEKSAGPDSQVALVILNATLIESRSIYPYHLPALNMNTNERRSDRYSLKKTFSLGPAVCGPLNTQKTPALGLLPSSYALAAAVDLKSSDNPGSSQQIQISQHLDTRLYKNVTKPKIGIGSSTIERQYLPMCCVEFFSNKPKVSEWSHVDLRVGCWSKDTYTGGIWKKLDAITPGYQELKFNQSTNHDTASKSSEKLTKVPELALPHWLSTLTTGMDLGSDFSRVGTVITVSSGEGDQWTNGITISSMGNLKRKLISNQTSDSTLSDPGNVFDRVLARGALNSADDDAFDFTFTTNLPIEFVSVKSNTSKTIHSDVPIVNSSGMKITFRLDGNDVDGSRLVPSPWIQSPAACGNQLPMDISPLENNQELIVDFAKQKVVFNASLGCPKGYTSSHVCWGPNSAFHMDRKISLESAFLPESKDPNSVYVTRFTPYLISYYSDDPKLRNETSGSGILPSLTTVLKKFPVILVFKHESFRSPLKIHKRIKVNLLNDRNCKIQGNPAERFKIFGQYADYILWERKNKNEDSSWINFALGANIKGEDKTISIDGSSVKISLQPDEIAVAWLSGSRSGDIVVAIDTEYSPEVPIMMRAIIPGCPKNVCRVSSNWKPMNPPRSEIRNGTLEWDELESKTSWSRVLRSSSAVNIWMKKQMEKLKFSNFSNEQNDENKHAATWTDTHLSSLKETDLARYYPSNDTIYSDSLLFSGSYGINENKNVKPLDPIVDVRVDSMDFFKLPIGIHDYVPEVQSTFWLFRTDNRVNDTLYNNYFRKAQKLILKTEETLMENNAKILKQAENIGREIQNDIYSDDSKARKISASALTRAMEKTIPLANYLFSTTFDLVRNSTDSFILSVDEWMASETAINENSSPIMFEKLQKYLLKIAKNKRIYNNFGDEMLPYDVFAFLGGTAALLEDQGFVQMFDDGIPQEIRQLQDSLFSDDYLLSQISGTNYTLSKQDLLKKYCFANEKICRDVESAREIYMKHLLNVCKTQIEIIQRFNALPNLMPVDINPPRIGRGFGIDISLAKKAAQQWVDAKKKVRNAWTTALMLQIAQKLVSYGIMNRNITSLPEEPIWMLYMVIWGNLQFSSLSEPYVFLNQQQIDVISMLVNAKMIQISLDRKPNERYSTEISNYLNDYINAALRVAQIRRE